MKSNDLPDGCYIFAGLVLLLCIPAWVTHVIVTIKASQWVFLLAGALFAPIGVIHGWGVWFGIW